MTMAKKILMSNNSVESVSNGFILLHNGSNRSFNLKFGDSSDWDTGTNPYPIINCTIYWGDGTSDVYSASVGNNIYTASHNYTSTSSIWREVEIIGDMWAFKGFVDATSIAECIGIRSWGTPYKFNGFSRLSDAFAGCTFKEMPYDGTKILAITSSSTSIPGEYLDDLNRTFKGCTYDDGSGSLYSWPSNSFEDIEDLVSIDAVFGESRKFEITNGLFKNNLKLHNLPWAFATDDIKINRYIFCDSGNEFDRFTNVISTIYFQGMNYGNYPIGYYGEAPTLWRDYNFGSSSVYYDEAFINQTTESLVNYNDIPASWK